VNEVLSAIRGGAVLEWLFINFVDGVQFAGSPGTIQDVYDAIQPMFRDKFLAGDGVASSKRLLKMTRVFRERVSTYGIHLLTTGDKF
jgi:hypothetical protein